MAAKAFLEQYMDCMDALPLELQRFASQYWEIDYQSQELIAEAQRVQSESSNALRDEATSKDKRKWLIQLQTLMLSMMEVGSEKLDVTSLMLDSVEGYTQQLSLAEKEMISCRTRDELTGGGGGSNTRATNHHPSNPASSSSMQQKNTHHHHSSSSSSSLPVLLEVVEKKKTERNQKRSRVQEKPEDVSDPVPPSSTAKEAKRDNTSSTNAPSLPNILPSPSSSTSSAAVPFKPIKKKVKAKKKNSITKEQVQSHSVQPSAVPAAVPTPDFTTEPIDPNEPTYCLCNQVSFGEMIGCDNDDCPIEWFHFQCIGLTAKPKGKWYCPQCQAERSKHRSGKT